MQANKARVGAVALALVLSVALTACGSDKDQGQSRPGSASVTPTPTASSTINPTDIAPGDELAVFEEGQEPVKAKPVETPTTAEDRDRSENPEKPVGTKTSNPQLPKDTTLPDSAEFLENASRLDGYNSFVALTFDIPWEDAVAELRASLEASGWECYECIPFVAGPNAPKETDTIRYFLRMQREGHRVTTVIAVSKNGIVSASLTFQG